MHYVSLPMFGVRLVCNGFPVLHHSDKKKIRNNEVKITFHLTKLFGAGKSKLNTYFLLDQNIFALQYTNKSNNKNQDAVKVTANYNFTLQKWRQKPFSRFPKPLRPPPPTFYEIYASRFYAVFLRACFQRFYCWHQFSFLSRYFVRHSFWTL